MVTQLQEQLDRSIAPLNAQLEEAHVTGELLSQRDLWIINALALEARPGLIRKLQNLPYVTQISLDRVQQYVEPLVQDQPLTLEEAAWGIEHIGAPRVWQTLAISGTGAVVAGMDTGVDWQHPALADNYRGNLGRGLINHHGAWFDAVNNGIYPYDDHGHGTHTLGTAAGHKNIGVAPGARWIGVKVLTSSGAGFDSDIHAGFQWLLAPGGDPQLAPDVVVCSWGSTNSANTIFQEDVEALVAADIFPIFAVGNEGPTQGSLRSPASLPGIFAVGASDPYDQVARFSGRGPSPWGEVKPYVVAPGVQILSAAPGGIYVENQGTSMATPHVAGVAALMRGISATLPVKALARVITETATPLTSTLPNNNSGWGRVDAYAALLALTHPGVLSGTVQDTSGPLADAEVRAEPRGTNNVARITTDARGYYEMALGADIYDLTATAFGHGAKTVWSVQITTDTVRRVDFILPTLPAGRLQGHVAVMPSGTPPTRPVTLRVLGTPVTATLLSQGRYSIDLPSDEYVVEVRGNGYRVVTASVEISTDTTTTHDFSLSPAPTLLLIDEGAWYYQSQITYWRDALNALNYTYDEMAIIDPPVNEEFAAHVADYDVLLWSSPIGSPGLVGAGEVLTDYLASGGRLFLSGQDVAYLDSGVASYVPGQAYLHDHLSARLLSDNAPTRSLVGSGPFAGLNLTISGGTGADNQRYPDEVEVRDPDLAQEVWSYTDNEGGGLAAHVCAPYRALFFSFGYEAIADSETRREVMARALDWLALPPPAEGLRITYESGPRIGLPGEQMTH
ncbi:MAG: S8 family serine peptidase, partial [Anaerolineae bacterium]